MLIALLQFWELIKRIHHAIHPGPCKATAHVLLGDVGKFPFLLAHDRCQ